MQKSKFSIGQATIIISTMILMACSAHQTNDYISTVTPSAPIESTIRNVPSQNFKDGGFLSGEPCGPPCFLNIVPGETKEVQAVQILSDKGLYKNCYFFDHESESGLRGAICLNSNVSITYFRGTDVVGKIGFSPQQQLTIEMVIEKYGEPDTVLVASQWQNWEEEPTTSMALMYDALNTTISLGEQKGTIFQVAPITAVEAIGYSGPAFPSVEEAEAGKEYLSFWHGYGEYQEILNP